MKTPIRKLLLAASCILLASWSQASGVVFEVNNALTDKGFNAGSLQLLPFTNTTSNRWLAEAAALVVGSENGISPNEGNGMLRIQETVLATSQVRQVVGGLSLGSSDEAKFSMAFNSPTSGSTGTLVLSAYGPGIVGAGAPLLGQIVVGGGGTSLDADPATWEVLTAHFRPATTPLPDGTVSLQAQVAFTNGTISANGYVDATIPAGGGLIKLVDRTAGGQYFVPGDNSLTGIWMQQGFIPSGWFSGVQCFGYDLDLCRDLILYATMDTVNITGTTNGSTVFDTSLSPNVHNGTVIASAVPLSNPAAQVLEGFEFTPSPTTVRFLPHPELDPGTGPFTVAIWAFSVDDMAYEALVSKGGTGASPVTLPGWTIYNVGTSTIVSVTTTTGTTIDASFPRIPINQWSHIMMVVDPVLNRLRAYLDGVLMDTTPLPAGWDVSSSFPILLAQSGIGDAFYDGILDDFAIWDRVLDDGEVTAVYDAGAAGLSFKDPAAGGTPLYNSLITTDVKSVMKGINPGMYARLGFNVASLTGASQLLLNVNYDDGFICYLNGVEVARRNAPSPLFPPFNATAVSDRPDVNALTAEVIDISAFLNLLQTGGGNILAFHALNADVAADRFLICAELCLNLVDCEKDTNGTDFWITFPENAPTDFSNPLEVGVFICSGGSSTGMAGPMISGTVEIPGRGFSQGFSLAATGGFVNVNLPAVDAGLDGPDVVEDKGVHITASADVAVYGLNHINYSTDTFLGLPSDCLGTEYFVLGYQNVWTGLPVLNGTQLAIVAPSDGTVVQIIPSVDTGPHLAGVPYYVNLGSGQTYQLRNDADAPADLSGTIIRANKRIGVFGGHRCANINGNEFFCDTIVEQILPVSLWGADYNVAPLATRADHTVRVLAAFPLTEVRVNGAAVAVLGAGQVFENVYIGPVHVEGRFQPQNEIKRPILVGQYSHSSDSDLVEDADPFFIMIQPEDNYLSEYCFEAPPTDGIAGEGAFNKNFVNVVLPPAEMFSILLDGVPIGAIGGAIFNPIPASGGLLAGVIPVNSAAMDEHLITHPGGIPFGLSIYGFATYNYDSYGHPGGMRWENAPPVVSSSMPEITVHAVDMGPGVGTAAPVPDVVSTSSATDNCDHPSLLTFSQIPSASTLVAEGDHVIVVSAQDTAGFVGTYTVIFHVLPPFPAIHFPADYPNPGSEGTIWGWDADPDGDGLTNRGEYKLGTDPNDPTSGPAAVEAGMTSEMGTEFFTMEFNQRVHSLFNCRAEGSEDLVLWQSGPGVMDVISTQLILPGGEFERITIRATGTGIVPAPEDYFTRLVIEP